MYFASFTGHTREADSFPLSISLPILWSSICYRNIPVMTTWTLYGSKVLPAPLSPVPPIFHHCAPAEKLEAHLYWKFLTRMLYLLITWPECQCSKCRFRLWNWVSFLSAELSLHTVLMPTSHNLLFLCALCWSDWTTLLKPSSILWCIFLSINMIVNSSFCFQSFLPFPILLFLLLFFFFPITSHGEYIFF